ncbi:DUF4198 domain-containing protein [Pseudophaeobacter sp. EL27]|uniref:DUF4198 domain-containing protein n=1 Tax=Pseudophaeobacter sp. EL27 TaxID=2107580 RepID=UPI000EFC6855|nr:DUF4198 domain-containing protein [Pseudophaeobacter sp. EL27]
MPNPLSRSVFLSAFCLTSLLAPIKPALSHEFWIEPEKYQVKSDDSVKAGLRNGQMFKGARLPYFASRIRRFETIQGTTQTPYTARMGDMPALVLEDLEAGLLIALHETTPDLITYESWEKFSEFANAQGFHDIEARHQDRGLPDAGFGEYYIRHTKLLVAVDHGRGTDRAFGMETEFVALQNPYTLSLPADGSAAEIGVQLLYQGSPRPQAQVELFDRAPDNTVQRHLLQTNAVGVVQIPVRAGQRYLLNAVVLRPLEGEAEAVWETLWASLVFAIP